MHKGSGNTMSILCWFYVFASSVWSHLIGKLSSPDQNDPQLQHKINMYFILCKSLILNGRWAITKKEKYLVIDIYFSVNCWRNVLGLHFVWYRISTWKVKGECKWAVYNGTIKSIVNIPHCHCVYNWYNQDATTDEESLNISICIGLWYEIGVIFLDLWSPVPLYDNLYVLVTRQFWTVKM